MKVRILFDNVQPFVIRAFAEGQRRFKGPFRGCRWIEVEIPEDQLRRAPIRRDNLSNRKPRERGKD